MLERSHIGREGGELDLGPPRSRHHQLSGACQSSIGAVDQGGVELVLELLDMRRHIGLDGDQGIGGSGERSIVGDGDQHFELAEIHH